jgi:hypothetical protein
MGVHTLVIYRASERADAALGDLARDARERGRRLTVLALAVEEPASRGCCDTRSVLWNRFQRGFAEEDLARARIAVEDDAVVELGILVYHGRAAVRAVEREARRRGADEIVVADPRSCGLSRRQQQRLRDAA